MAAAAARVPLRKPWRAADTVATLALLLALQPTAVLGLDNGVGRLPPLGWNTWCVEGQCARDYCTAAEVKATADIIVAEGLRELGWTHVNLDECVPAAAPAHNPVTPCD